MEKEVKKVLDLAARLQKQTGLEYATIGRYAVNNSRILDALANGGDCQMKTLKRLKAYIESRLNKRGNSARRIKKVPARTSD